VNVLKIHPKPGIAIETLSYLCLGWNAPLAHHASNVKMCCSMGWLLWHCTCIYIRNFGNKEEEEHFYKQYSYGSGGLSLQTPTFDPRPDHVEFLVGEVAVGQVLLQVHQFLLSP